MVTNVTSLTGNGLKDWLIQRVTAIFFAVYVFFLLGYLFTHHGLSFEQWHGLMTQPLMLIATTIALVSISLHSWVGIWTVSTDYINCTALRVSVQMLVVLWLLIQLVWGIMILWGR
ncbi:MAG: succinate dehydrogenase, hydrophobic membrane anchor protein [Legionella sp. 40-6]|nr:succinate dehydrogenase, hydrophobic membrane anchor protein [Legionella sp.]OJX93298.1 MAG: succinate dehydrogenase, hydrophobic membrane anchor protein [Legionella sp. 40-6]